LEAAGHSPGSGHPRHIFSEREGWRCRRRSGQVWKTTDGDAHWKEVLNLSYPWYWYGVKALNTISGFYDSSTFEGIIRWSQDGGSHWDE
jgi:photosystem II stability/assembly factor-like uncharacterized protein